MKNTQEVSEETVDAFQKMSSAVAQANLVFSRGYLEVWRPAMYGVNAVSGKSEDRVTAPTPATTASVE